MKRHLFLLYGIVAYLIGLGTLLYLVFWVYPWSWMPTSIDSPKPGPLLPSLLWDLGLILLFGVQHSLMVRPRFKAWFDCYVSYGAQRPTYTLISSFFLALILVGWRPLPGILWHFEPGSFGWWVMTLLYFLGWGVAVIATFMINHFAMLGLYQAWRGWLGLGEAEAAFTERGFYRWIRHPIQAGTLLGLWATPVMSTGHLLFALSFTIYVLIGLYFEERDLMRTLGKPYADYRRRVPMLFPFIKAGEKRKEKR
ncbi:methyltransferase family protein [Nitratifractor salsuginis]|uniref:NnrU domain-containing protein n=1 Tax=Nitratifractor salsuginis (strain DSM 16511 / JCM 12458 / E9I37-1) TaxID=749222 RepID=E6X003_NITSE|nr:NnrU family protein [Nitratifractor salsuginis]ADV46726.1 hypothetical protein Nitsa_1478 [Nitratifractor salsuginis DSM 16511]